MADQQRPQVDDNDEVEIPALEQVVEGIDDEDMDDDAPDDDDDMVEAREGDDDESSEGDGDEFGVGPELLLIMNSVKSDFHGQNFDWKRSNSETVRLTAEDVIYVGLDLKHLRDKILAIAATEYGTSQLIKKAIVQLVTCAVMRGNNIEGIVQNSRNSGVYQDLFSRFSIRKTAGPKNFDVLTLNRVSLCFPQVTAKVAIRANAPVIPPDVSENYPLIMRTSSFSGLIPKPMTDDNIKIKKAFVLYQAKVSLCLRRSTRPVSRNLLLSQAPYVTAGMLQSELSDAERLTMLRQRGAGIFVNGMLNPVVITMAEQYNRLMSQQMEIEI